MFEPLEKEEKQGSGRSMKIIWIVLGVAAIALALVSFM
jgi:flagellar basal body-associated protein FliL